MNPVGRVSLQTVCSRIRESRDKILVRMRPHRNRSRPAMEAGGLVESNRLVLQTVERMICRGRVTDVLTDPKGSYIETEP